jgi:phage terminase small subunit
MGEWRMTKLSARHHRVIDEYFVNGRNQTQAMISQGYKESSARLNAHQFFRNKAIQTEIQKREREMQERYEISREWIIERLARIADSGKILSRFRKISKDGQIYWDFRGATREDLEVIADLQVEEYQEGRGPGAADVKKTKISVNSPLQALEGLSRIMGFNQDKLKVEGELTVIEQLQAGRARIAKLRHAPVDAIDAEYSEIGSRALEAPKEEVYVSQDEQEAVDVEDDDLIEW